MAKILCIETATTNCSVSVAIDGKLIALKENSGSYSHAEKLHLFIEEAMKKASLNLKELDAIAISKGPGSYTGLRIGVSAAKGLCFSLDKPLISVSTLVSLSKQISPKQNEFIVPMLDARRMEVYSAIFDHQGNQIREIQAEVLNETSFLEYLEKGKVHFIGDGVEKFKTVQSHANAVFWDGKLPSSKEMATIAEEKFHRSDFEDVAYFEPFYLKDFVGG
ncbi:MAG TPA: tRNA (adenosine(37)-N6)-threonylcarbamoyltransferase complex dimerization subunit type 1 TsaB [Flavobacteriaceae bacterium]|nr:tRNA (adenosine(37)-N6)-threonylcarbamoyltransferase complex dimerization subunit type 1 TsaB [Flavobacteriaceae bacterium]